MTLSVTVALIVSYVLLAIRIGLIVACCAILYRVLRLAALPWIAAWYALGLVTDSATAYFFRQILPSGWKPGTFEPLPAPLPALGMVADLAAQLSTLLIVLLIFAEAAFVLQRLAPNLRSELFRILAGMHRYVRPLGIAALFLTGLAPVAPMVYYYTHAYH